MKELMVMHGSRGGRGASRRHRVGVVFAFLLLFSISATVAEAFAETFPPTATATPTPDLERLDLEKTKLRLEAEKLRIETEHLRIENANDTREPNTGRGLFNLLLGNLTILTTVAVGAWGLYSYFAGRRAELRSSEEARFEGIVKSLGSEHAEERVSASVLLPTFLSPKYERFHEQIFNLAAGHLRAEARSETKADSVAKIEIPSSFSNMAITLTPHEEGADSSEFIQSPHPPPTPASPSPLAQALANVLSKSYRLAFDAKLRKPGGDPVALTRQFLNAAGVKLDGTYLAHVNLRNAWLRQASLRGTALNGSLLTKAILEGSDASGALLNEAELVEANLKNVDFTDANLREAVMDGADLDGANFTGAILNNVHMTGGTAASANFSLADLTGATFEGVDFSPTASHKLPSNPEAARSLLNSTFKNVIGLSEEQVSVCKSKGATFLSAAEIQALKDAEAALIQALKDDKGGVSRRRSSRRRPPRKTQALKDTKVDALEDTADAPAKIEAKVEELVSQHIETLKTTSAIKRREAVEALGGLGEVAIPQLISALKSPSWNVRGGAAHALGSMGAKAKESIPNLIEALKDIDSDVRRKAADALGRIGGQAMPQLIKVLENPDALLRAGAAYALGKMGVRATEAIPDLIRALEDSIKAVRRDAADALGEILAGTKESIPQLTEALHDTDEIVRMNAERALQKIGRRTNK